MTAFGDRIFAKLRAGGLDVELLSARDLASFVGSATFRLRACKLIVEHDRGSHNLFVWLGGIDRYTLIDVETALGWRSLDWVQKVYRSGENQRWRVLIDDDIARLVETAQSLEAALMGPDAAAFRARLDKAQQVRISAWLANARNPPVAPVTWAWRVISGWASRIFWPQRNKT